MLSNQIKARTLIVGAFVLTFGVFSFTDSGLNVAAVLLGTETLKTKCIQKLPVEKRGLDYTYITNRLNTDSQKDVILTATTDTQCGTAGCAHELCIVTDNTVELISFGYAAETLIVRDTASNGMYDIQLRGKSTTNLQWDGTRYSIQEQPL